LIVIMASIIWLLFDSRNISASGRGGLPSGCGGS
jgi:hypothetical protein